MTLSAVWSCATRASGVGGKPRSVAKRTATDKRMWSKNLSRSSSTAQGSLPVTAADSILAALYRAPRTAPLPFRAVFQKRALPSH